LAIRLSTNLSALGVNRSLGEAQQGRERVLEKLASGSRIARAADDAAGLSISERLKAKVRSFQMATRNSVDGISLLQTAEGGTQEVQNILVRLRELSVQAASDTMGEPERQYTNLEFQSLKGEVDRIAQTTSYNGTNLLNGLGKSLEFQVGINADRTNDRVTFSTSDANITPASLGISSLHLANKKNAQDNLRLLDSAMNRVSLQRALLGSVQSALSSNAENMGSHQVNSAAANSRLRDVDMAEYSAKGVQLDIIANAATAMHSQANNLPARALKLLEIS
jgi:flagellin